MRAAEHDVMRTVEDRHWWHAVLRSLVEHALAGRLRAHALLLDAGCGTGGMLAYLQNQNADLAVAGVDAAEHAVRYCHQRGLETVQVARVEALPFADGAFDAVLSLDVLYHADVEENGAVSEMSRVLRPEGLLVLNLPAFATLRGAHDEAVAGVRRYSAAQVRTLLEGAGLIVEKVHYWNAWLFVPLLVWRQLSRLKRARESDLQMTPGWMNRLLAGMGRLDAGMCREFRPPFGSSVFAVAHKGSLPAGGNIHGCN